MVTIRTTCSTCGEVDVRPSDIDLVVRRGKPMPSTYAFRCPLCRSRREYPASAHVIDMLLSAGVQPPATRPESLPPAAWHAPAFRPDDLLDFHLLLERPDWFELLLAVGPLAASLPA
jgi:hypothetical protein